MQRKSGSAVAQGTAETGKVGFPQNIPLLIAYALQAVGIISAIKGAVGKTKKVASTLGAGSGGGNDVPSVSSTNTNSSTSTLI